MSASKKPAKDIRAPCGFHCSSCKAYRENAKTEADKRKVSGNWQKIYGLSIPPEAMHCDGCHVPDVSNPYRIGGACPIRSCVLEKKITHCGKCTSFPCDLIEKHLCSVEKILPEAKETLSAEEIRDFVDPYLCRDFLVQAGWK